MTKYYKKKKKIALAGLLLLWVWLGSSKLKGFALVPKKSQALNCSAAAALVRLIMTVKSAEEEQKRNPYKSVVLPPQCL